MKDDLREKVISSLETIKQNMPKIISWQYDDQLQNIVGNIELAIVLLKSQEPVKPIMRREMDDICSCINNVAYCGKCGTPIGRLKQNYCSNCGQAVKWE